jgi:hypothetical protein
LILTREKEDLTRDKKNKGMQDERIASTEMPGRRGIEEGGT